MKKALIPKSEIRIPKWKEADMFWYGFIVGLFIGANVGLLVFGLLNMAAGETPQHKEVL